MTAQHEIRCSRNAGIRTVRHDYMVNRILTKIDHHRHPRPVDKAHGNLPVSDKLEKPDIEFQYKNATYVLDVTFAVEANICNAFKGKILKYGGTYGDNRVIPLVLRYNGTVYEKSMNMLTTFLPEITDSFLSKHCCLAVARANEEAKLHYTSLITNALHEGTIATKQGQRDRQATGRRALRAPPGLEGVGARQEGEAQGNAGSDGLGVTAGEKNNTSEHERVRKIITPQVPCADDIQISHDQNVDKDVVLQELAALLQPLGLELALNKCSSTQDGGEITFLGQTFSQSSTVSLAERMTAKIDKCLKVLDAAPITNHQKFLLLRSVVLPKVNYAPLVDFAPKTPQDGFGNQYGLIDQKVFKYASDLFAVKDLSETEQADFFTNSASKGGLEMVVPSLYYDFMQAQQKAVLAGGVGIFKALRKEYLNTLQDHPGVPAIGYAINNFTYLTDNELFDLIKHRFQVLNKELDSDSKCLLCGKKMTAQHEIRCSRNAGIRTVRHDYMVNRILTKIDHHRHPRPVDKAHGNLPVSDKLEKPDIEFQYKNATYVLDVTFAVEANICNAFKGKILKYGGTYGDNRVIPLVLRYNGTVYEKSMNMLTTFLPEITDSFLSKHCCLAVARANEEAKLHYTSLITNALHEGTIATKQGQRDRQATGRRALRAPPGLEGVGARQEGEAQGNAGSDGLGVTAGEKNNTSEHERVRKIITPQVPCADDIQISHDQNVDKDVVLQELAALLQPLGLELALNKCSSTQDGGEITFLGQTFSQSSTVSLAERMTAKIDKCLKVLDASPITNHQKFLLLRSVVLPKVNYAPLVDFAPKTPQDGFGNQYGLIDQKVFKYASDLFAVKDLSETEQADFFTNSASKGGLEMVVPSLYYDFMQAQQKAVLAGGVGIFKALRKEYLNTLQDHPGVPAIGYAINNFTYLTDNELFDLIKHRFQVLNKELDSDSKCLLCGKKMTAQHEIRCSRNAGIRTVRHDYMVNRILTKIDHHRHPRPVDKAHGNLPVSDKLEKPDIEFQYKNATYVLDVTFAVEANICNAFKGKILKYGGTYGDNRVIPLVLRYNGTVYEKSMNMLTTFLPEITDSFLTLLSCSSARQRRSQAALHQLDHQCSA
ncbi:Reverse_transcriptase/endonuclease [Hexamita inflata]|uniref:Putative n=1 Tax=Hexamita inflata TaxID=28002 RepID=A0ABP1GLR4_9EUKA